MREIKFRAWSNKFKKMCSNGIDGCEIYVHSHSVWFEGRDDESVELMQYTGLKDKNGKEIYEGDIIRVHDDYDTFGLMACEVREVYFLDGGFRLKPKDFKSRGHWLEDNGVFEVIGNIYENPELLK